MPGQGGVTCQGKGVVGRRWVSEVGAGVGGHRAEGFVVRMVRSAWDGAIRVIRSLKEPISCVRVYWMGRIVRRWGRGAVGVVQKTPAMRLRASFWATRTRLRRYLGGRCAHRGALYVSTGRMMPW